MNILGILNGFSQGSSGGDTLFLQVLADNKYNHITILTSHLGKLLCEQSTISADYIVSSYEKAFSSPITIYLKRIYVSLFLIKYPKNIDQIITASDSLPDTIPAFFLTGRGGITWTAHTYHIVPWGRLISRLTQELSIFLMGIRASTIKTASSHMKSELMKRHISPKKIIIFKPIVEKKVSIQNTGARFDAVWMGRIHPAKGIQEIVQIWKTVVKEKPDATLGVIGTGEQKYCEGLQQEILAARLSKHIKLLGHVPDIEAFGLILRSRCFIHTSHEEGYSLIIDEVLELTKTPVIAYALPALMERLQKKVTCISCFDTHQFAQMVMKHI